MSLKKTENIFVLGIFLACTGLLAAGILGYFNGLTKKPIQQAAINATNNSLKTILPSFETTKIYSNANVKYYGAFDKAGKLVAIAGESSAKGYAGDVVALVGINLDGTIRNVIIIKNSETPGLGSVVCERKEQKTIFNVFEKKKAEKVAQLPANRYLDFYSAKSTNDKFTVAKDGGEAPYMTGATITSRAVAKAVSKIGNDYAANSVTIIAELNKEAK